MGRGGEGEPPAPPSSLFLVMSNREKINGRIIRNTTNVLVYCTFFLLNNPLTDMVGAMECKIVWKISGMEMDLGSTWQKGSSYRK